MSKTKKMIEIEASSKSIKKCNSELLDIFGSYFNPDEISEINMLPPRGAYELLIQSLASKIAKAKSIYRPKKVPLIEEYKEMSQALRRRVFDEYIKTKIKSVPRNSSEYSLSRISFFKEIMTHCVEKYGMRKMTVKSGSTGFVADFTKLARGAGKRFEGKFILRKDEVIFKR